MQTDFHVLLAYLPMYFTIISTVVLFLGLFSSSEKIIRTGLIFFMIDGLLSLVTGATGGAIIKLMQTTTGVNPEYVSYHAWISLIAVMFSVLYAIICWQTFRLLKTNQPKAKRRTFILLGLAIVYIVILFITNKVGVGIRSV